jgi:hypothetical protein
MPSFEYCHLETTDDFAKDPSQSRLVWSLMPRSRTHNSGTHTGDTSLDIPPAVVPLVTMQQRNGLKCFAIHRICPRWEEKGCFWNCSGDGCRVIFYTHQHTCCCTDAFPANAAVNFVGTPLHFNSPALLPVDPTFVQLADYIYLRILNNDLQPTMATGRHQHIHPTTVQTMNTMPANVGFMSWLFRPIDITVLNRDAPQQFRRVSTQHNLIPHDVDLRGMYQWLDAQVDVNNINHLRIAMKRQLSKHLEDLFRLQVQSRGAILADVIYDPDFPVNV